jgi:hypothetical protein
MTKVISSQTSNAKYFLTIDEAGHAVDCTCGDQHFRCHVKGNPAHQCKHLRQFNAEVLRASAFLALKARIANAEREARVASRIAFELAMGL